MKDDPKITIYRRYVLFREWSHNILDYTFITVVRERVYSYSGKGSASLLRRVV